MMMTCILSISFSQLFDDYGVIVFYGSVIALAILCLILREIILFIPKRIAKHRLAKCGGFKCVFSELLDLIQLENPDLHASYDSLSARIGKFYVLFLFNTLTIRWNKLQWKFDINEIKCDICKKTGENVKVLKFGKTETTIDHRLSFRNIWQQVLDDIILSQSLKKTKTASGSEKRSLTISRFMAYPHEKLVYSLFKDMFYYSEEYGYAYSYALTYTEEQIIERIQSIEQVCFEEANEIFQELKSKDLIKGYNNNYELGSLLIYYWNIITEEDSCINKWSRSNNLPRKSYKEVMEFADNLKKQQTANSSSMEKAHGARIAIVEDAQIVPDLHSPLYIIYRVGPEILTYQYSVDTDVYKEIYEEDGIIGPSKYEQIPEALEALCNNENDWFIYEEERKPIRDMVIQDLLTLAKKHNMPGAYSALGSLCGRRDEMIKYWKQGATLGNKESMVAYGMMLYCEGRTTEGFLMLKQGADAGDKLGCFLTAVSYHYGTLSEIDLNKAADYYIKSLGKENDFYSYLNVGSMLIGSGYFHTAVRYFEKMFTESEKESGDLRSFGDFDNYLSNLSTSRELLKFPYEERIKRVVLQEHSRSLDPIFCENHKRIDPFVPEHVSKMASKWEPSKEMIEIDELDIVERNEQSMVNDKRSVDENEDYLFLTIPVKIDNPKIYGTQTELLFLEKECHAELNKYIQDNLIALRSSLKSLGYLLTYLPAHSHDHIDSADKIGSYHNDYGDKVWKDLILLETKKRKIQESEYWESLVPGSKLPDDCAGFLRYVPNLEDRDDHTNYEYILFPYRPGTDWPRAFRSLIELLRGKPIIPIYNVREEMHYLPSGTILEISSDYEFVLKDSTDNLLETINMPTLSKVLYLGLLKHPEGIIIKNLIDYKEELWNYYQNIAGTHAKIENIETLCDPTNNSIHEKISRIRSAFTKALADKYSDELPSFVPTGKKGEAYSVSVDRSRINNKGIITQR